MEKHKIVLIGGKGKSTNAVFHYLDSNFGLYKTIIEKNENRIIFLRRRVKKLGIKAVIGQLLFQSLVTPILIISSRQRRQKIIDSYNLRFDKIPENKFLNVKSINSISTIAMLKELKPDLIIVNGTRIISNKVINSVDCRLINIHAGITPKYRGVHGAYWAMVNKDYNNIGVTVHYIDTGIDTGQIICQAKIQPKINDNFCTYPLLQLSEGLIILKIAIVNYFNNNIITQPLFTESFIWSHPTIWEYLYNRLINHVK